MSAEGPRLGPFRHALVTALGEEGVTLVPWPEEAAAQGLYVSMVESAEEALVPEGLEGSEAEAAFESARAALPGAPYATDYSVTLSLEELQDARRMGQEAAGEEAAEGQAPALPVPPVPPPAVAQAEAQAEAQFKAAAAALAEARKAVAASGKSGGGRGRGGGLGGVLAHLRREEGALD